MSESFAGITVPEGDPGGVEALATSLAGMGGQLEGAAERVSALPAGTSAWQGPASVAFSGACMTTTGGVRLAAEAFVTAAGCAARYAHQLHDAQHGARAAIRDARDATHRIHAAEGHLADARERAAVAGAAALAAAAEVAATGLIGTPSPTAQAAQSRAESEHARAEGDAARAQRQLDDAQEDLRRAQAHGHAAMEDARQAAQAVAAGFTALGGAPPPPPPGPPASGVSASGSASAEADRGFFGSIGHAVTHPSEIVDAAGDAAGAVKDFTVDTGKGIGDFAVGMKDVAVMGWHLSPVYGLMDPAGQQREVEQLGTGLSYAWHHPAEFGKQLIDYKDIVGGHPGRAFGQLLPNIVLTAATAGGGAAAKGAEATSAISRLETADGVDVAADAGTAARGARAAGTATRSAEAGGGGGDLVASGAAHGDDLPPVTYRGDSRAPEDIFATGFEPRGTDTDLLRYAETNHPSAFVGTSLSPEKASEFVGPGGFRYMVRAPGGIDVNAALGKASPFPDELEIAFQGGIRTEHIMGAHPILPGSELGKFDYGEFIHNPAYAGH